MTKQFQKDWRHNRRDVIVNFAVALIATVWIVALWYGGLFANVQCDPKGIDKEFLFCFLHPLKVWDVLGLIISSLGAIALAYPVHYFNEWWENSSVNWRVVGLVVLIIGHLLIFAL